MIRADELSDINDRLLLEAQRAANRDDWGAVAAAADEVLKNDPLRAEAMFLAGCALRKAGNEGMAALMFRAASSRDPKRGAPLLQLAMCLHERRPEEAYQAALKAQTLMPDTPDGLSILCNVASSLGRNAEALDWAERSEKKHGLIPEVCHNKSFALMALGRWAEGWREFKASLGMPNRKVRNYHADKQTPRWNPNKHEGAVVAIYGEQGIGDEVLYASMLDKAIEAAEAKGSRVVIECYQRNEGLFRRSFPGAAVYGTLHETYCEWPADEGVTHKLEMGGLGEFFGQEPFRRAAFLAAEPCRAAAWKTWLGQSAPKAALRVGLAWTGGAWESGRARRSIPFELILQLMRGQDATFVCLEYEDRRRDLEFAPDMLNPTTATRKGADMDELAALLVNLDLVISVQTSVVDYCGALGVPCWAVADHAPQWRYAPFFGDDTMGVYEGVKVYRQPEPGAWGPVVQKLARDLDVWIKTRQMAADQHAAVKALNGHDAPDNDAWVSC